MRLSENYDVSLIFSLAIPSIEDIEISAVRELFIVEDILPVPVVLVVLLLVHQVPPAVVDEQNIIGILLNAPDLKEIIGAVSVRGESVGDLKNQLGHIEIAFYHRIPTPVIIFCDQSDTEGPQVHISVWLGSISVLLFPSPKSQK